MNRQLLIEILKLGREARSYINMRWLNLVIAYQIRAMRKSRGWTQAELAKRAELTVMTVVRLERFHWGKNPPSLNTLGAIAAAFDVALMCRFTSWSEFVDQVTETPHIDNGLTADYYDVPSYDQEIKSGKFDDPSSTCSPSGNT